MLWYLPLHKFNPQTILKTSFARSLPCTIDQGPRRASTPTYYFGFGNKEQPTRVHTWSVYIPRSSFHNTKMV